VRSGVNLGRVELVVKGLESKKDFHNLYQINDFTPHLKLGNKPHSNLKKEFNNLIVIPLCQIIHNFSISFFSVFFSTNFFSFISFLFFEKQKQGTCEWHGIHKLKA